MPQRHFSVIINPDAWDASIQELARAVAPITSVRAQQLVPVLERGAMTIDADLSRDEANRLFERLAALDVPARIMDGDDSVVRDFADLRDAPEPADGLEEPSSAEQPVPEPEEDIDIDIDVEEVEDELLEPEGGWDSFLGDVEVEDLEVPDSEGAESDDVGSDDVGSDDVGSDDRPPKKQRSSTMIGAPGAASVEPDSPEDKSTEKVGPKPPAETSKFGAETMREPASGPDVESVGAEEHTPPRQIPSRGVDEPSEPDSEPARPRPNPAAKESGAKGGVSEKGFDASRMNAALESDSDRPPFEPDGFDDRTEHIPALAAALSLFAPGAGQTYNGEPEKSWEFGTRFLLLAPWYKSVRQAWERAEKIRTYYAPRPTDGSLLRALKYAAGWWMIVGGAAVLLGFGGYAGYNVLTRPERPKITEADIQSAHDEARRQIRLARIGGLDGVSSYLDERDGAGSRFTMSEKERVERLFRRGYESCESREYSTCEAVMKRVSSLSPKYRREAYKLQAWASMQRGRDSADEPMPSVEIDSLETFETRDMKPEDTPPDDPGGAPDEPSDTPTDVEGQPSPDGSPDLDPPDDSEDAP